MLQVDGTFGLNFLLVILRCLDDYKRHCGVCPDCAENKCLTKARGCLPVRWLMGAVSSQQLSLGHGPGASSALLCSALLCSPLPDVSLLRESPSLGGGARVQMGTGAPGCCPSPRGRGCSRCGMAALDATCCPTPLSSSEPSWS